MEETSANSANADISSIFIYSCSEDDCYAIIFLFSRNFRANCVLNDLFWQLTMKKDRINDRILQELKINGRIANAELADHVGLSPSACLRRVQELEKAGVIKGYRAVINNQAFGLGFVAYVGVGLNEHSTKSQRAFEHALEFINEVKECHNVTGAFEYLLRVETADIKSYKAFHADVLGAIPQVRTITSHIVMDSPKDERT
jgi:Lrp/AsnC family leucine-responsive transcriptional regulator